MGAGLLTCAADPLRVLLPGFTFSTPGRAVCPLEAKVGSVGFVTVGGLGAVGGFC